MLCCLTLELSGRCTAAFRLNELLGICGRSMTWPTAACRAKNTCHKPHALKLDDLPRTAKKSLPKRNAKRQRATQKPELTNYPTSKRLTLELSGGEAVRLERVVSRALRSN
jgi:hypothetical protein